MENVLTGSGDDTIIGSVAANDLDSGAGADNVSGGKGDDTLIGGAGADTLNGEQNDDTVDYSIETGDHAIGADLGGGSATDSFGDADVLISIENITTGSGADLIVGSGHANVIATKAGADVVDAGGGADSVTGAGGDDSLIGGSGADTLDGGAGADTLDGGGGADSMIGGAGGDLYQVDDGDDVIVETATGGGDTAIASVDYTLGDGVFVDVLQAASGRADIDLAGNELNNVIVGNGGANLLAGAGGDDVLTGDIGGVDTLIGGAGSDLYLIEDGKDRVIESAADKEIDAVAATKSYALEAGEAVEGMAAVDLATLTTFQAQLAAGKSLIEVLNGYDGGGAHNVAGIDLTGNQTSQLLAGNNGDNRLDGLGGKDMLVGYAGNDTLVFEGAFGKDTINDFQGGKGPSDVIELHAENVHNFSQLKDVAVEDASQDTITFILKGQGEITLLHTHDLSALSKDDFSLL